MSGNDNNTIIDFGHDDLDFTQRDNTTVIEISSSSDATHFKAGSSGDMRTILDNDDTFGLNLSGSSMAGQANGFFFDEDSGDQQNQRPFEPYPSAMPYHAFGSDDVDEMELMDESSQLPPGTMIAERYEILHILGAGGFSLVYKAYDKKLQTQVAVKELYPPSLVFRKPGEERVIINGRKIDFDYLLDRFVLEARTMAKYNSDPNIVNIFDCVLENNTAYIIMEYLDGQNLEDYCFSKPERKMALDESIRVICCVLDGLERVHKKGIVHRDIKPKNIILTSDGEVKIIDFGAARFYATEEEVVNNFTKVLTPGFAPPEQYRKDKKQGAFTDVYASAATFYFMLTGEVPEISVDRDIADHLKPLSEMVQGIPDYVDIAVRRAMVLNCDLRVQNASDFKLALLGKKTLRTPQEEKRIRIRNRLILLIATVLLFGTGLAGFFLYKTYYSGGRSICDYIKADDTIELWLPVSASDESAEAQKEIYDSAVEDYMEYVAVECGRKIKVETKLINENEYADVIAEAYRNNSMPDVFDSSAADVPDEKLVDCDLVFRYLSEENYALLSYYKNHDISRKRFAVGFDSYVVFYNDKLKEELGLGNIVSFDSMLAFGYEATHKYGICCKENIYDISPYENIYVGKDASDVFRNGDALCYIGKVSEAMPLFESLPGFCKVIGIPGKEKVSILPRTWSVFSDSDNKVTAAQTLLYYMTGEDKQDWFYLQHRGVLPVNQQVLSCYSKFYSDFSFITDDNSRYVIESFVGGS